MYNEGALPYKTHTQLSSLLSTEPSLFERLPSQVDCPSKADDTNASRIPGIQERIRLQGEIKDPEFLRESPLVKKLICDQVKWSYCQQPEGNERVYGGNYGGGPSFPAVTAAILICSLPCISQVISEAKHPHTEQPPSKRLDLSCFETSNPFSVGKDPAY